MPFTGSHPAAVLPLVLSERARRWFAPSALVIGSLAPDLPYYLPLPVSRTLTHSLLGVPTTDLLIGLLAVGLWHGLLGPAVVAVLPQRARRRVRRPARVAALRVVPVLLGLLTGALTHVVWDAFTHVDGWGTGRVGWLAARHGPLAGYRWAQYASGLIGAAALLVAVARWWRATPPGDATPGTTRAPLAWAVVVAALLAGAVAGAGHGSPQGLRRTLFYVATWSGGFALAAAVAVALVLAVPAAAPARRGQRPG